VDEFNEKHTAILKGIKQLRDKYELTSSQTGPTSAKSSSITITAWKACPKVTPAKVLDKVRMYMRLTRELCSSPDESKFLLDSGLVPQEVRLSTKVGQLLDAAKRLPGSSVGSCVTILKLCREFEATLLEIREYFKK
jgi:hypothetical protein